MIKFLDSLFDTEDLEVIIKGMILTGLGTGFVLWGAVAMGAAWKVFQLAGGL